MPDRGALGAIVDGTGTTFRVWAPDHEQVDLVLDDAGRLKAASTYVGAASSSVVAAASPSVVGAAFRRPSIRPLAREDNGYWSARFDDVGPGDLYRYRLNGASDRVFPDPASRFQPRGVHGPSEVVDPSAFAWTDHTWRPPSLESMVFYELHVGTFSPEGTFRGALERLPHLADLGVTAIELMPLGDFPGDRNWGYDGVAIFAPARCYGTPDDLRALVDAAHRLGIGVAIDVIYNHFGPDGAYANVFSSHYFTDAHASPWGRGVNLDDCHSAEVRRFFIENALHWIREYHVDALRLDATHAMQDASRTHFLAELTSRVRALAPRPVVFVAEDYRNLAHMVRAVDAGGFGIDAVWADDFHHHVRVHMAGDREGYYVDYSGSSRDLATTLRQGWFFTGQRSIHLDELRGTDPTDIPPPRFVICTQNHDQVGNRADGARLNHQIAPAAYRASSALLLLAPQTPLLFMGQEWAASSPFLFFTDHHDELGRLITDGRRAEFTAFAAFADPIQQLRIPDPQSATTFERSRLDWSERTSEPHAGMWRLYQRLLKFRALRLPPASRQRGAYEVCALDDHTIALTYFDPLIVVVARLSGGSGRVTLEIPSDVRMHLTTEDPAVVADPLPIETSIQHRRLEIRFPRPSAIVLTT